MLLVEAQPSDVSPALHRQSPLLLILLDRSAGLLWDIADFPTEVCVAFRTVYDCKDYMQKV
jgi:hypothetical protein